MRQVKRNKPKKTGVIAVVCILVVAVLLFAGYQFLNGKQSYPLQYEDLIVQFAGEYGLDPYLVAAIIHTESGFDPDAVSRVGAIGLMQVMPDTGEWIAGKLGLEDFDSSLLHDPSLNIRMGCWYLNYLKGLFDQDITLVAAAYNAGQNRVKGWLKDDAYSKNGSLTNIPYAETEQYVKKVTRAYEKYKELYQID